MYIVDATDMIAGTAIAVVTAAVKIPVVVVACQIAPTAADAKTGTLVISIALVIVVVGVPITVVARRDPSCSSSTRAVLQKVRACVIVLRFGGIVIC